MFKKGYFSHLSTNICRNACNMYGKWQFWGDLPVDESAALFFDEVIRKCIEWGCPKCHKQDI